MNYQEILFSNFLGKNRQGSSALNQLLEQPDSLPRLIEEDTFVSEFKSGTQRVKDFMTYQRFEELTEYVTVVGNQDDKKRGYKFPLSAWQLLVSDNSKIEEYFLPQNGVVVVTESITKSVQQEVERQIDEDEDEDEVQIQQGKSGQEVEKEVKPAEQKEEKAKQGEDEQFGDFVAAPAKKKKIVKVKEAVDIVETITKEHPPLINKLLEYLASPINYTLTSYVCRVMVNLLNRKTITLLGVLFKQKEKSDTIFDSIFEHLGSRSTVDLLTRIFTIEDSSYIKERFSTFERMINYLSNTPNLDSLSNVVACTGQVYQKLAINFKAISPVKALQIYTTQIPQLLQQLYSIAIGTNEQAASYSISIITQLLSNFNVKEESAQLQGWTSKYLQGANIKMKHYLDQQRIRLGVVGFKFAESFNILLKVEQFYPCFIKNKQLGSTLLGLVKKYPLNNIFHNQVFKFLTTGLSTTTELPNGLFENNFLLQWLHEQAEEEQRRRSTENACRKGYYGHLYNLCVLLKENKMKNTAVQTLLLEQKFKFVDQILVQKEGSNEQQRLAGFDKNKKPYAVMYDKDSILELYSSFLAATPKAVMEKDLDDPLLNPILLQQLQRQLDGVQLDNANSSSQVVEEQHHKADLIDQNQHNKQAFWRLHMDYDVDGLMQHLL